MAQRLTRTLLSASSDQGSEIDEELVAVGRRLRMRKMLQAVDDEEQREDKMLKELGLFEIGMSREQKKELLSVVAASEKSATMEEKSRLIGDKLDCNTEINPELFCFSQITAEPPDGKPHIVDEDSPSVPILPYLLDSCPSSPNVVPESPDMLDISSQSPKRQSEKEKKTENEDTLMPYLIIEEDNVNRKYDRRQIDPMDFIEDIPSVRLIDKRKCLNKEESYWSCCCPDGTRPRDFAKSLRKNFEMYHTNLYAFQRRSLNYLTWGDPVVVGRHCSSTLDLWSSRQSLRLRMNSDAANKESEIIDSKSEDEFDSLLKKVDAPKRKFNFKRGCQMYGQNRQEKSEDSEKCVFSFIGSSDEDGDVKKKSRTSKFHDRLGEVEQSSLEDISRDESGDYIPSSQPAKKRHRPLQLGLARMRPDTALSNGLEKKSFYGSTAESSSLGETSLYAKTASQKFNMHHVTSEEAYPRIGAPKQSTNLQDVIKPNLKININKVGLRNKWLCKNARAEQSLAADMPTGLEDEVKIVDTFSASKDNNGEVRQKGRAMRKLADTFSTSKDSDGEIRQKGHAMRKLINVARSLKPNDTSDSIGKEKSLGKRLRLGNDLDGKNEETVTQDKAKKVQITYCEPYPTHVPESEEEDELPDNANVPCPLCGKKFAQNMIEAHASDCQEAQEEPRCIPTRTPKNKHRCYICQRVFYAGSYKDHVVACAARKQTTQTEMHDETTPMKVKASEMEKPQKENYHHSLLNSLDTPKIGTVSLAKAFNCVSGKSPFGDASSLRSMSVPFNHIDEGNCSMTHMSTPTFQMFKPISQLKDSKVDFKNQFPVARQAAKRRPAKSVKTKKRRRSLKGKKSPRGRKSK